METPVNISITVRKSEQMQEQLYRHPHDKEVLIPEPTARSPGRIYRGDGNAIGKGRDTGGKKAIPEPFRLLPDHQTPLDCACQKLIRDINPMAREDIVDCVLDHTWILANGTGLDEPDRINCRTGEHMNEPGAKWPAFHTPIVCGGAVLKGEERDGNLWIETIRCDGEIPSAEYVLARPWLWFYLVMVTASGNISYMSLTGTDGQRHPVKVPLITRFPVYAKLEWLDKLPFGFIPPDALWMP